MHISKSLASARTVKVRKLLGECAEERSVFRHAMGVMLSSELVEHACVEVVVWLKCIGLFDRMSLDLI
jgi:hypothetical protein